MITNKLGLPQPLVEAVANDPYDKGDCMFSATELIAPPYQKTLLRKHKDEISVDVSDRIWSLWGQAVHHILERSGHDNYVLERRYIGHVMIGDLKVSVGAKIDVLDKERGVLSDYKCTSVYKFKRDNFGTLEPVPEYEQQINIQAECIFQETGLEIAVGQIVGILRDFRKSESMREAGYPKNQVEIMDIPIWPHERRLAFIEERVRLHLLPAPEPCSASETWERPTKWAMMKPGAKRALRLYESQELAAHHLTILAGKEPAAGYHLVERPGTRVRCAGYCEVAAFCEHYKAYLAEQGEKNG